ncbi:MAG: hypothetical protein K6A33_01435 [Clostridiales bacterium]|nr:hypothetical protein [Clostridiales bacterium]
MTTKETSAYIKGLLDGTNLDVTTPEGKIIAALVDLCGKLADEVETLTEAIDTANDYLDELDHDLGEVEEFVYETDDEDEGECCGKCRRHHPFDEDFDDFDDFEDEDDEDDDEDEDEDDEEEEEFYCTTCPHCGGKVYFDDTVNPEDVICPACHKPLLDEEEDEEDEEEEDE